MDQALLADQQRLSALGLYHGALDGLYGPATENTIEALLAFYEQEHGTAAVKWPKLDAAHAYLRTIDQLPMVTACYLDILGTIEVQGTGSSKLILSWRDELNISPAAYPNDGVPWCGLAAAIAAKRAGKDISEVGNVLWAANWAHFGVAVDRPMLGDYMVWHRTGGGHVNNYVGEETVNGVLFYHGIGGNQSDQVNIMAKRADVGLVAVRRPIYQTQPAGVRAYNVAAGGTPISTKES
jgi:uncharacterized protein (TIGR02594 family)